jgi:hypothetical protein
MLESCFLGARAALNAATHVRQVVVDQRVARRQDKDCILQTRCCYVAKEFDMNRICANYQPHCGGLSLG